MKQEVEMEAIEKLRDLANEKAKERREQETETERRFREWRERLRKKGLPVL